MTTSVNSLLVVADGVSCQVTDQQVFQGIYLHLDQLGSDEEYFVARKDSPTANHAYRAYVRNGLLYMDYL